jgi:hypothetical protein
MAKGKKRVVKLSKTKKPTPQATAWGTLQAEVRDNLVNYRDAKLLSIQKTCLLEKELRGDTGALEEFCSDDFWDDRRKRPSPDEPDKILHYLFLFVFDRIPNGNKKASEYKRAALEVQTGNLPREKIAEELKKRGGITGVLRKSKVVDDSDGASEPVNEKKPKAKTAAASGTSERKTSSPKSVSIYSKNQLIIDVANERTLDAIFKLLAKGAVILTISLGGEDDSGFKRIILEDYNPE